MHLRYIPENHNLKYWCLNEYHGLPVQYTPDQPLVKEYLDKLWNLVDLYTQKFPRVLAIRVDLHCFEPTPNLMTSNDVMQNFKDALVSRIHAYQRRQYSQGKRIFCCPVKIVWAREQKSSHVPHFHLLILINHDLFYSLGDFQSKKREFVGYDQRRLEHCSKDPS
ncbi:MAG: inovirus Gp2 family protein [Nitrincola sp.]|nr:inovirus Gp2 family protein [Nitrincola sp.]